MSKLSLFLKLSHVAWTEFIESEEERLELPDTKQVKWLEDTL